MLTLEFVTGAGLPQAARELLLQADPDSQKIEAYLQEGLVLLAHWNSELAGILVMGPVAYGEFNKVYEIYNLAVDPAYQRRGIARALLQRAQAEAQQNQMPALLVRTGNSSLPALALYTRMGFRIVEIVRDYFPDHYAEPILEDGIPCLDQLVLVWSLSSK